MESPFGNYKYTLTAGQQQAIQVYLRFLPEELQQNPAWRLLHKLTYAQSWTPQPLHKIAQPGPALGCVGRLVDDDK